jgi:hypothetical protein
MRRVFLAARLFGDSDYSPPCQRKGGRDINKIGPFRSGADGVDRIAQVSPRVKGFSKEFLQG